MTTAKYVKKFKENRETIIARWKKYLTFESISTDPAFNKECTACAQWLTKELAAVGLESRLIETSSKPVVWGEFNAGPDAPTILYYGHYDVQPVDPLDQWETPPFQPSERNGRLYARGAVDNKGQSIYFFEAVKTLIEARELKVNLKVLMEGEEEGGSEALWENLHEWKEMLKADYLMVCDSSAVSLDHPTITMGIRGIIHLNFKVKGASYDLHSGIHGGLVKNPAQVAAQIVASLHNPDGSIAIPGYCDDILPVDAETEKIVCSSPFSDEEYEKEVGVKPLGGEQKYPAQVRRGFRPTIEVNGFHSGYGGAGHKTVIGAEAEVKLTSRLVVGQDPKKALMLLEKFLLSKAVPGVTIEITEKGVGGEAVGLNPKSPLVARAARVLKEECGGTPVFQWSGASLPIVGELVKVSESEPLMVGFCLTEDRLHAPNESFSFEQVELGYYYACGMLAELGKK